MEKIRQEAYPEDLSELIDSAYSRDPSAVFLNYTDSGKTVSVTHSEFKKDYEALSSVLRSRYGSDKRIAIIGANSYNWIVLFISIVLSGNTAVAIDHSLPPDKIKKMIRSSGCSGYFAADPGLLDDSELNCISESLNDLSVLTKDTCRDDRAFIPDRNTDRLSAIFFSSGTSSERKMIMLSQKNIMADINGACDAFTLKGNSLSVLPFHHVLGFIVSILMTFRFPYPVYINRNLRELERDMKVCAPQTMVVVPLYIESFCKKIQAGIRRKNGKKFRAALKLSSILRKIGIDIRKRLFAEVRSSFGGNLDVFICGGAELDQHLIDMLDDLGITVLNGYGMTETASVISLNRIGDTRRKSLGKPLSCCRVMCDTDGEFLVSGDNVMKGYLNDISGSSAAFSGEWFRTGDIGTIDRDGFLYFKGRKKNLIVLSNGENVSPEEIESELLLYDQIEEVIVSESEGCLRAEIYPAPAYAGDESCFSRLIRRYGKNKPPYLMIHRVILRKEPFEKNSSGKIIRRSTGTYNTEE